MAKDRLSSKLVAILHADIAGSTLLVQQDRELAHERIRDSFRRFSGFIETYSGRVLEIRGDALLASFDHSADAVSAALSFQLDQSNYTDGLGDDIKPYVRIGISIGEIIVADNTVTGAGVVQAQRIEQLAGPGQIYVTAAIHEALSKRLPFDLESLGEQVIKGFEHPVHVYRITSKSGVSIPLPNSIESARKPVASRKLAGISALLAMLLIAAGIIYWFRITGPAATATSAAQTEIALPDRPSIAVLPFTNMSSDAEQNYFADGMTDDLITDLSKLSGLFVISRNTVFTYKGKAVNIREVAEELGVRYVLEGSVRKVGNQVRINTQLIDASNDGHIWAERYDGSIENIFALQDKVTSKIVTTLSIKLTEGEQDQIAKIETDNPEAYDTFLRGWEQYQRQRPESFLAAIELFEAATRLDENYSRAYAALSLTYWQVYRRQWAFKIGINHSIEPRYRTEKYLALAMKNPSSLSYQVSANLLAQQGLLDEAISSGERAIALDPNDADSYVALAGALNLAGRPEEALLMVERAVRLNPRYPASYLYEMGLARFGKDDFEGAANALEKALVINPEDALSSRLLIATLGHMQRIDDAAPLIENDPFNSMGVDPLSIRSITFWFKFSNPADTRRLTEGLRKAGVPE